MGVVVRRNPSNSYQAFYLHDVVVIEKSKAALSGAANPNGSVAHSVHASVTNILQQIANVNNLTEADISSDEGRFSISDSSNKSRSTEAKQDRTNVASQVTNSSNDANIISANELSSVLKEKYNEYETDEEDLRIATAALDDLQRVRIRNTSKVSEDRWSVGNSSNLSRGNANRGSSRVSSEQYKTIAKGITALY